MALLLVVLLTADRDYFKSPETWWHTTSMNGATIQAYNKHADVYHQETENFWANFPTCIIETFTSQLVANNCWTWVVVQAGMP